MSARSFPALGYDPAPGTLSSAEAVAERVRTTAARIREGVNDVGHPVGRMGERIGSLFAGDGFTTAEQRRDIADRTGKE